MERTYVASIPVLSILKVRDDVSMGIIEGGAKGRTSVAARRE